MNRSQLEPTGLPQLGDRLESPQAGPDQLLGIVLRKGDLFPLKRSELKNSEADLATACPGEVLRSPYIPFEANLKVFLVRLLLDSVAPYALEWHVTVTTLVF